jgi:hypothetical protein
MILRRKAPSRQRLSVVDRPIFVWLYRSGHRTFKRAGIFVVDDEPDIADLFLQRFRRESREGAYVLHFAFSAA